MKGAAEFCLDWLIDDGKGHLVTAPSTSPELGFRTPDGREASVSMAATMDMSILWELFSDCLDAARILGIEPEFARPTGSRPRQALSAEDRRARPVAGVVPGLHGDRRPSPPSFAPLRRVSRTADHPRHARAFRRRAAGPRDPRRRRHGLVARLEDQPLGALSRRRPRLRPGEEPAAARPRRARRRATVPGAASIRTSSTPTRRSRSTATSPSPPASPRCWCRAGWPSSRSGRASAEIELLPALPSAWPEGSVRGLRARGGFEVAELSWAGKKLQRVTLASPLGGAVRVRSGKSFVDLTIRPGGSVTLDAREARFLRAV